MPHMYATVPASIFLVLRYVLYLQRASPKSAIFATPSAVIKMLPGLRSLQSRRACRGRCGVQVWAQVWVQGFSASAALGSSGSAAQCSVGSSPKLSSTSAALG
eukprot:360688-Chlamydomonas_euryale.AAC.6